MTPPKKPSAKKYDFVAQDPITNMMVEVKIVRYCPPDETYEMPISTECASELAVARYKNKLIRYLSRK